MNAGGRQSGMRRAGADLEFAGSGGSGDPRGQRSSGQWHVWGLDRGDAPTFSMDVGVNSNFNNKNSMSAVPCWFPEEGRITALALAIADSPGGGGTGVPSGGEYGWIGVAPDSIIDSEHYAGRTIEGSGVRVIGAGSGTPKVRGGLVSVPVTAGSMMWLVHQNQIVSVAGVAFYGGSMIAFPNWGGYDDLRAVALDDTPPTAAPGVRGNSAIGYCSLVGSTLAYTFERDFPTGGRRLRTANDGEADANQLWNAAGGGIPYYLYQWSRT
jgi:hypothetical protein